MESSIILYALPVFGLLIAVEWLYGAWTGRRTYRANDCISSLSQGLLSQATAACTKLFQIGLYSLAFVHFAAFHGGAFWDTPWGWVLAIVMFDFCDYWLHRAGHEVAVFWAAHVVHHQSEDFNFSTALRQESFVPFLGWLFYLPMAVLGVPPAQFVVAGLVVLLYQFWIHTEHVGKLGWFDRVFSSPSNHRVHHAVNAPYIDKNYGGMLVIWDRLFGTFAAEAETCVFGTQAPLSSWNPLWAVGTVYIDLARKARATTRVADKLRVWIMPPGWLPAELRLAGPPEAPAPVPAERYNPPMSRVQCAVAAVQLVLMTALTAVLLYRSDELGWLRAALLCAAVAAGLWMAGAVMQSRVRLRVTLPGNAAIVLAALVALW